MTHHADSMSVSQWAARTGRGAVGIIVLCYAAGRPFLDALWIAAGFVALSFFVGLVVPRVAERWCPRVVALMRTPIRLRNKRAERPAHAVCAKCGYELTGLVPDARCPECGAGPAESSLRSPPS
ncbi:MAG: hypothetical protein ACKVW3_14310 [Phycisphaerales bacterium]